MNRYRKCQCGAHESFTVESLPCFECAYCHTTLVQRGEKFERAAPHRLHTITVQTDEGDKPLTQCVWCGQTKAELLKAGSPIADSNLTKEAP